MALENLPQSLDDILDGKPPETAEAQAPIAQPEPEGEPSVAKGEGSQDAAPPAASHPESDPSDNSPTVPRRALEDERRKRQDYEKQLKDLQAKFTQPQPQRPKAEAPQIPDPVMEPEKYVAYQQQVMASQFFANNVRISQRMMRDKHEDYNEVEAVFVEAANSDPHLARQLVESDFPAEFAYQMGKKLKLMREIGDDPGAFIEAKVAERLAQNATAPQPPAPALKNPAPKGAVPKSLAGVTSSQPRDETGRYSSQPSLSEIID